MEKHQAARQLRRPPLFGVKITRNRHPIVMGLAAFLVLGIFDPMALGFGAEMGSRLDKDYNEPGACAAAAARQQDCSRYQPSTLSYWVTFPVGLVVLYAIVHPIAAAHTAAVDRAFLCSMVGRLKLDLGDTEGANEIIEKAQQELQKMTKRTFRQFWVQENMDGTVRRSVTSGRSRYISAHIDPNFDPRAEREVLLRSEKQSYRWWCCCCCPVGIAWLAVVIFVIVTYTSADSSDGSSSSPSSTHSAECARICDEHSCGTDCPICVGTGAGEYGNGCHNCEASVSC
jgi:hypothetical protein